VTPSNAPVSAGDTVVVLFGQGQDRLSGFCDDLNRVNLRSASTPEALPAALPGAHALLCWEAADKAIGEALSYADQLRWLQWPFIGVDRLIPYLKNHPKLTLTNASGVFDEPIGEYVLGLVLAMAKDLPGTWAAQSKRSWAFRETESIAGKRALILGVGGVGCAIAAKLKPVGMDVIGVGRTAREGDAVFSKIATMADLPSLLSSSDYVIAALPLTAQTRGLFSARMFASMRPAARFINVGRGELVDEQALIAALRQGRLAGAALDVFQNEPLPVESPLWTLGRLIISPHMAGDIKETPDRLECLFRNNLKRFIEGEPLVNKVDIDLGFVPRD
jgi:phosphoglycerate dehydrogenase-like enzyme